MHSCTAGVISIVGFPPLKVLEWTGSCHVFVDFVDIVRTDEYDQDTSIAIFWIENSPKS